MSNESKECPVAKAIGREAVRIRQSGRRYPKIDAFLNPKTIAEVVQRLSDEPHAVPRLCTPLGIVTLRSDPAMAENAFRFDGYPAVTVELP